MSNINISGSPAVVSAFRLFGGDSAITIHRDGDVELGPAWANAGDAATAFFNELTEHVVPSWGARIRELEAENERLLARLAHAEDDCEDDCIYCEERRQEIARAALEKKQ